MVEIESISPRWKGIMTTRDEAANAATAIFLEERAPANDGPGSRDAARSRRKRPVRARTVSVKRLPKYQLELGRHLYPVDEHEDVARPTTRGECAEGVRPCPFVSCKHHLYLDVSARTGAIKLNFPDLEPDELAESCALDVAGRHGVTLEEAGAIMNLTRERIRQVEVTGMAKIKAAIELRDLRDLVDVGPVGKRRLPVLQDGEEADERDDAELEGEDRFDVEAFASDALDAE